MVLQAGLPLLVLADGWGKKGSVFCCDTDEFRGAWLNQSRALV
jgi:hypothetical protein